MPSQAFVQVVADTDGVQRQMERELSQIIAAVERSLDPVKIKVELDDRSVTTALQDLEARLTIRHPEVTVDVNFGDLDRAGLNASLARIQSTIGDLNVNAQLQFNELQVITALARMQHFLNARHLTVHADVDIDRNQLARLLAAAGSSAGSVGGAAAGEGFAASLLNAPAIAGIGLALGPILIASLGSIASLGIGAIVAGIAFQGFGDAVAAIISGDQDKIAEAMKGLAPSAQDVASEFGVVLLPVLRDIQDSIQQAFFLPLIGSGTDLAAALEKLEPSLVLVADAMGKFVAKLIEILTQDDNIKLFNEILTNAADIITRLAPYIGTLLVGSLQALNFILSITVDSFHVFKDVVTSQVSGLLVLKDAAIGFAQALASFAANIASSLTGAKGSFGSFGTTVREKLQGARDLVAAFPGWVRSGLSSLQSTLTGIAINALSSFRTAVVSRLQGVLDYIRSIPSRARAALGNLAGTLRGSGQSLIQGFIDGIRSKIGQIAAVARDAVNAARKYFPFSPAKEGPFSGRGYTTYSGAALIDGFVSGIKSGQSQLQAAMNDTLSMNTGGGLATAAAGASGRDMSAGLVPQSFTSSPNITLIIGNEAIEGAVETVVEGSNARRDRQLVQGVRR